MGFHVQRVEENRLISEECVTSMESSSLRHHIEIAHRIVLSKTRAIKVSGEGP